MATENTTYWAKKSGSARAIEANILARQINEDWLQSSVTVTHYQFVGELRESLMDLIDSSAKNSREGTNFPTSSLRLMLQICLQDVLGVARHLSCKAGSRNVDGPNAIRTLGPAEEGGSQTVARIVREWAMSTLEPWSMDKGCADIALRVKTAAIAANVVQNASNVALRDPRSRKLNFPLVARLLADQLRGQSLFEGLGACELVLPGPFDDASFDLISAPRTLAAGTSGVHTFSMIARVHVSTMPCSDAAYVSVTPSKRVWSDVMPKGINTGNRATAYAFPPQADTTDAQRAVVPLSIQRKPAEQGYTWDFNGDEYAVVKEQARLARQQAPDTLESGISESAQDKNRWWIGLPQTTRLYRNLNQHTPSDADEVDLMQRCSELLEGFADEAVDFELRSLPLNRASTTAMVKAEDCGTVGAALLEADLEQGEEDEDELADASGAGNEVKLAAFREQCIRVLGKVYSDARPTLWLLGGTQEEVLIAEQIVKHLFGDYVTFKRDPLPEQVHGLRQELPGAELRSKQRFNLRVDKWKDAQNPGGLLNAIASHEGPKFVLVCADKAIGYKQEDVVNRRAAIHAICSHTKAGVHHVLPMESANTPLRQARARQNFIHRLQSAMTDVMLAHSGHVINVNEFAKDRIPSGCKAIYGIQALRKNAQKYSGETPVCMLVYSRINLTNDTTEVQYHYGSGSRIHCSAWMPLSEGLIWLASQRSITSDETWLRANFETQTRNFLIETQEADTQAVVLIDWGTLRGLWKDLSDDNLRTAPKLGNLPLKQAFSQMSFIRVRYGFDAKISVRGISTTFYEAIRYEGASKVLTGNVYKDAYATTTKRLVEITAKAPEPTAADSYLPSHFIGMMTPRKTSQGKRGLSCFRSVSLMNRVGKNQDSKDDKNTSALFEIALRPAQTKDNVSPGPIDISVLQNPNSVSAHDLAVLCMGLRLGYPHYDEWTQLPAPLFFIRKVDDYIIKYPDDAQPETAAVVDSAGSTLDEQSTPEIEADADDEAEDEVDAIPAFELVSQMVQQALKYEPEVPVAEEAPAETHVVTEPQTALVVTEDPEDAEEASPDPDLKSAIDIDGKLNADLLLQLAKAVKYQALLPFAGTEGIRKRKFFTKMMRGEISVTVEVPYFVSFDQIFNTYPKPDGTKINREWRQLRNNGYVRQVAPVPNGDFAVWLAKKMMHPQGAYIVNARALFGKHYIIPQLDAAVSNYNDQLQDKSESVYVIDDHVNLGPIVSKACAQQDDETLGWLVFCAAQCPAYSIATSVLQSMTCVPGPRTKAALAYYVQCVQALQQGLPQISASLNTPSGQFKAIHFKRPTELATPPASELTSMAKAVQASLMTARASAVEISKTKDLRPTAAIDPLVITASIAACAFDDATAPEVTATDITDPVMKIKNEISQLLHSLQPGQDNFAPEVELIRALLVDLESIDSARKADSLRTHEMLKLCSLASAKAQELLSRIKVIDYEDTMQTGTYRPVVITSDLLDNVQKELASIELKVRAAEKTEELLQERMNAVVPEFERRRNAHSITALDIEREDQLKGIQAQVIESGCYIIVNTDDPDDGLITEANEAPSVEPLGTFTPEALPTSAAETVSSQVAATAVAAVVQEPVASIPAVATVEPADRTTAVPEEQGHSETLEPNVVIPMAQEAEDLEAWDDPEKTIVQDEPTDLVPEVKASVPASTPQTPEDPPAQTLVPAIHMKEARHVAPPNEHKDLEISLSNLRALMDKRHYGLASVYINAIESAFGSQKDIGLNYALLQALVAELQAVDCNSLVQPNFNQWQTQLFEEVEAADGIAQAVAVLAAGLSSAIFFDPSHNGSDPLWVVLGPVKDTLQDQPALKALIDHVATREKTAVYLTQSKLIMSYASSEDRLTEQLATYRERARNWASDLSMHTNWSHMGFARAHEYIYSMDTAVGKCLALVAKDDVKALKHAMKEHQGKFRKPKATLQEAFRKIRDHTELNGNYLVYAKNNLEVTETFLNQYVSLSEQKTDSGQGHALLQHERDYIKSLHTKLKDAIVQIDEIISRKNWTNLESISLQSGRNLMQAVIRLFDDTKADACVPQDIQRMLIQQPMGTDLMPSIKDDPAYNQRALLQGDALIDSINALLQDELVELAHPITKNSMDRLLQSAQDAHIANNRFVPAHRIEALLTRPKARPGSVDQQPSLLNQYTRASSELQRKLQEIRQRVTHAMALSALTQKNANDMLYTLSSIESVLKQGALGKPDCRSPAYPDFPHAYFHINESITKVLDSRMLEATERLQALLQNLRELKGSEIQKDIDRIERMLATKKPADLRAAGDAIRLLDSGQKLPTSSPQRTQDTPKQFEQLCDAVGKIWNSKEGMLESLLHVLEKPAGDTDPGFITHLDADQRLDAATFIKKWIGICQARQGDAADKAGAMFAALGLGVPQFTPESTARGAAARLEFPTNPFASLSSDCFIPPQLGSQQSRLPAYAIYGAKPDNEIATIIHDMGSNPVVIMARTTLTLKKRMKDINNNNRGAAVILIEDYLIAFMAVNPKTRAQKMLEIGLLNFQTNPYSAEGAHVAREMFFGRQSELSALRNVKNAAILYGGRRLGKSSLLAQVERDENRPQSGRRALYIPMNKDYSGNDHVLFAWKSIYEHLMTHQIIRQMPMQADSAQTYADWIESSLVTGPTTHCYLLLDEADDLMAAELELVHGQSGFTRSLQNVSESLAAKGFTLRYCIAGLHNLARMTTEVNSALGKAETIALEPFTRDEDIMRGIELIIKPMAALGYYLHPDSDELPLRIMSICNFYPALIQIYCRKLLSNLHNKRAGGEPYCFITLADIERVESDHELLADLSKKFSMTLDLDTRYKAIALVLADIYYTEIENGADDGATMQDVRERCDVYVSTHFRNINTSAFESLLDEMRKLNVLEKSGNRYRLRNPSIAMLLGDKERVMSQIGDLAQLQPSRSINHGEKRIPLQVNENSRATGEPLPYFPMPISWIQSQIGGKPRTLDGSLPILCGNAQSGLQQISPPKLAGKLTQTDDFYCHPVPFSEMGPFIRTKTCTGLIPANGNLLLMSASAAWKTKEIASFSSLASRSASSHVQVALAALPPRIWEMMGYLKDQKKKEATSPLDKWNIVAVPPYSIDAIQFHLGDNRSVADSRQACEDILYATCGFGRWVQKHCSEFMTVEKAALLKKDAEKPFSSMAVFYDAIGIPSGLIPDAHLRHMEAGLLLIHGESRNEDSLEYINDLLKGSTDGSQPDLDKFDLLFLQLAGLLQEGQDSKWHVPLLYQHLLKKTAQVK